MTGGFVDGCVQFVDFDRSAWTVYVTGILSWQTWPFTKRRQFSDLCGVVGTGTQSPWVIVTSGCVQTAHCWELLKVLTSGGETVTSLCICFEIQSVEPCVIFTQPLHSAVNIVAGNWDDSNHWFSFMHVWFFSVLNFIYSYYHDKNCLGAQFSVHTWLSLCLLKST